MASTLLPTSQAWAAVGTSGFHLKNISLVVLCLSSVPVFLSLSSRERRGVRFGSFLTLADKDGIQDYHQHHHQNQQQHQQQHHQQQHTSNQRFHQSAAVHEQSHQPATVYERSHQSAALYDEFDYPGEYKKMTHYSPATATFIPGGNDDYYLPPPTPVLVAPAPQR